jgi:hypothetical protein
MQLDDLRGEACSLCWLQHIACATASTAATAACHRPAAESNYSCQFKKGRCLRFYKKFNH